jgi:hypothetical protein
MPTTTRPPINASGVSRSLRSQGFRPSHPDRKYKHEGVFVENGMRTNGRYYEVRVSVHIDAQGPRERMTDEMATALRKRGYEVEISHNPEADASSLIVTRPAVTA